MSFGVVSLGMALYFWQKRGELYALLMEGSGHFEELRQRAVLAQEGQTEAEAKLKTLREGTTRLKRAVDEARERSTELTRRLEEKEQEARLVTERLESQKAMLERHLERTMEAQKRNEEREAAGATAIAEAQREFAQRASAAKAEAERRVAPLKSRIEELERALALSDARANKAAAAPQAPAVPAAVKVEPGSATNIVELKEELKRLRRRIAQADRLFAQMRGLKEMVEERSHNWEIALRKLSTWILAERRAPEAAKPPEAIGPLVGQALAAIGAQLIDDDELDLDATRRREPAGASRAADMDAPESDALEGVDAESDASSGSSTSSGAT
jgi:chromosome segregation ATPase